jgi:tryptophanyl-tRNA synthetase
MKIVSGIQSSGKMHLGNYFGAIVPFLSFQDQGDSLLFIANLHSLTTIRDASKLKSLALDIALDYLALGLDPEKTTLFKQSDIPEVTELYWYLTSITPISLLNTKAYQDKINNKIPNDVGLFTYPVLMAADILLYDADIVPVGKDQVQHIDLVRDIAIKFNIAFDSNYKPGKISGIFKLPSAVTSDVYSIVPGTDGNKMSKSTGNVIDIFSEDKIIHKQIMGIKTDSLSISDPKNINAPLFQLMKLFFDIEQDQSIKEGGIGYGNYKQMLIDMFHAKFDEARLKRKHLINDLGYVERVLIDGRNRARENAKSVIERVRQAVGV